MCLLRSLSVSSNMSTSLESTNALKSRASEVALTTEEANALTNNGVSSLARSCAPGQTPTDDQLTALLRPVPLNPGASLKRLIFEAQTLICSEVKSKAGKREDSSQVSFAAPEWDARIVQQRNRLTGLRFKGEEECSHASYDLVLAVLEKDCLTYLGPEKFPTRRKELMQKKPSKEISIDQSQLVVKDKLTCPTVTELEIANAFKRRALAFDLAGASTYDTMAAYHADLMDHLHLPAPPGYTPSFSASNSSSRQSSFPLHVRENEYLEKECKWNFAFGHPLAISPEPTYCGLPFVTPRGISKQGKFVNQNTSHGEEKVSYSDQTSTQEQGSWQRKIKEGSWTQCPKCPHWWKGS